MNSDTSRNSSAKLTKISVSHILVEREYEAEDILRALKDNKSFPELAKKFSKCSSAPNGGFLGEIALQRLDADFVEAALQLLPGEISSKPVRTRFGYHLIRREKTTS